MIKVTRLSGNEMVVNADLIEFVEASPDTVISLVTGKKIMVKETTDEIIRRVAEFRRRSSGVTLPKTVTPPPGEENG